VLRSKWCRTTLLANEELIRDAQRQIPVAHRGFMWDIARRLQGIFNGEIRYAYGYRYTRQYCAGWGF
jgi:hypothetical protein